MLGERHVFFLPKHSQEGEVQREKEIVLKILFGVLLYFEECRKKKYKYES